MAIVVKSRAAQNEIRDLVRDNWKQMKDERSVREETWKRCVLSYLCEHDKKWVQFAKQANRSHRFVNLNGDAVETVTPQIIDAVFGVEDWLQLRPLVPGFDQSDDKYAEQMKQLAKYQMMFGKYRQTASLGLKSMMITGNCPWTMAWKTMSAPDYLRTNEAMEKWLEDIAEYHVEFEQIKSEYTQVKEQLALLGQPPPPPPEFEEPPRPPVETDLIFQGPVLQIMSIFNYVQEQHPNDDFSSLRIGRSWRTTEYLKKLAKPDEDGYRLYENIEKINETSSEERESDNEAEALFKMAMGLEMPHGVDKNEVKEMHGTFELSGAHGNKGLYENYIATIAGNTLIRCEPSPMYSGRPQLNNARLIKLDGDPYGTGIIEKALDEQDTANAIHNQNIDAVNTVIQPEMEVVEVDLTDGEMKPSGPGVHHMVERANTITPIVKNFQGIPMGFEAERASIARHERITGAINTSGGSDESATRTARNTNVIAGKLGSHVVDFEDEFLNESMNISFEMNAQYLTDEQIISITQDGSLSQLKIDPAAIRRGWYVYSAGSKHLAEKDQRIQQLLMAQQMVDGAAASGRPTPVREAELWTLTMKEILGDISGSLVMSQEEFEAKLAEFEQKQIEAQLREAALAQQGTDQAGGGAGQDGGGGVTGTPGAA